MILKLDGFDGQDTESAVDASLYLTEAVTAGDWIAVYAGDTTNPAGTDGDSYRRADSDNADALYDTVGVAVATTSGAGMALVRVRGRISANVTTGASGDLAIGSTAGRAVNYSGTNPLLRVIGRAYGTAANNTAVVSINPHPRFLSPA